MAIAVTALPMTALAEEAENVSAEEIVEFEEVKEAEIEGYFDGAVDLEPSKTVGDTICGQSTGPRYYRINIPSFGAVRFKFDLTWNGCLLFAILNPETEEVVSARKIQEVNDKDIYLNAGTYYVKIYTWLDIWSGYENLFYKFTPVASPKITSVYPGNGSAHLSWKAIPDATKYAIYTYVNGKYTHYRNTTLTNYTVKGLKNGTKYGFLVKAYVGNTWTPYKATDRVYTTPVNKPAVTAYAGNGKVRLEWGKISGATKYAIYTYLNGKYSLYRATTANYYNVTGLENGTEYGFLVKAYVNGKWTTYNSYDIAYATPIDKPVITKTVSANGRVRLYWSKVFGATKYAIYVYTGGKYRLYRATTANAYTVSDLNNGTSYGFLVRAYIDGKWTTYNVYDKVNAIPKA